MSSSQRGKGVSADVDAELYRVLIRQASQVPMWVVLLPVLALFVGDHVPRVHRVAWGIFIAALMLVRWWLAHGFERSLGETSNTDLRRRARLLSGIQIVIGLVAGLAPVAWFPDLFEVERAVIAVAFFGWFAAAVVVSLVHPLSAYLFGMALLGPLSVAWAFYSGLPGLMVAIITLMLLFSVRQTAGGAHQAIREAIRARLREAELGRHLEQRGRELEAAMGAKSAFLAAASHDLRQPVTSMSLLLSALYAARDEKTMRSVAARLEAPLQALEDILSSILEVSRLEAGVVKVELRQCVLGDVLGTIAAEYLPRAQDRGLALRVAGGNFEVFSDPDLLKRILRNLVENALKFTDAGGISIQASRSGSNARIDVEDSGRGIPQDAIDHVFEDYFQAANPHRDRGQGLGLGLSIVRRLVELLGGTVSVTSEVGRGTRFTVTVPGAQRNDVGWAADIPVGRVLPHFDFRTALIVEDDRLIVDAMHAVMDAQGVDARFASSAEQAFEQVALGRFVPEVALVDFGLPGGMDGIDTILALRERMPGCRYLLVTGDTRPEVIRRAAMVGINTVHKPLTMERIVEGLRYEAGGGVFRETPS